MSQNKNYLRDSKFKFNYAYCIFNGFDSTVSEYFLYTTPFVIPMNRFSLLRHNISLQLLVTLDDCRQK